MANIGTGQNETIGMDRVSRVWNQRRITRAHRGHGQMGEALFRSNRDNRLAVRIQFNPKTTLIPAANGLSKANDALGNGVTVGRPFLGDFN